MNRRIKKKQFKQNTEKVVYCYLKNQYQFRKYGSINIGSEIFHIKYGFISVTENSIKRVICLLKKAGYKFRYKKIIFKNSIYPTYVFNFC